MVSRVRIGTLLGIPLEVNPLFFVLLLLAVLMGYGWEAALLTASILFHEWSHTVAARLHRMTVTDIALFPFGGVCSIDDSMQLDPTVEIRVALSGPAANLLVILAVMAYYSHAPAAWHGRLAYLLQVNASLISFNLLPALPLDGGRVFRSVRAKRRGFRRATETAVIVAQVTALLLISLGAILYYYSAELPVLLVTLMGGFLYLAAVQERKRAAYALMRYLTRRRCQLLRARVWETRVLSGLAEASAGEVLRWFVPSCYHVIWVIGKDGQLVGWVSEMELIEAMFNEGLEVKLGPLAHWT